MKKSDRITGLILILFGISVMFYAYNVLGIGNSKLPGPGAFPLLCGLCITIFSVIWILPSFKEKVQESSPLWGKGEWIRPLIAVLLISAYGASMDLLGYTISTFLFLLVWQFAIEREKWLKTTVISLIGSSTMYFLFTYLLKVSLP